MNIKRTAFDPIGASNSKIVINRKRIDGPIRSVPHTDYKYFTDGHRDLNIRPPSLYFGEVVKDLYDYNLNELVNTPDATYNLSRWLIDKAKPLLNDLVISVPRIKRGLKINAPQMRELVEAQVNAQLDVVTIPDPKDREFDLAWKYTMETGVKDAIQLTNNNDHDVVMPIISLNQPHKIVTAKINYLLNLDIDINSIGFRSASNFGPKLRRAVKMIRSHDEEEIREMWLHFTDGSQQMRSLSQPHLSVLGQIDTISTRKLSDRQVRYLAATSDINPEQADFEVPQEPPRSKKTRTPTKTQRTRKPKNDLLEPSELLYQSEQQHLQRLQQGIRCNCPTHSKFSNYASLSRMLNSTERKKFVTVHDLVGSTQEFSSIQQEIINQDLINYYRHKPAVVRQSKLIGKRFGVKL